MYAERLVRPVPEIEVLRKFTERTVRQHMIPPGVVLRGGHVVRHDVQENSKSQGARAFCETDPGRLAAEVIADSRGIRDIVAMLAARDCLQARREIHMAYSQIGQVRQRLLPLPQGESSVQLQTVARDPFTAHG